MSIRHSVSLRHVCKIALTVMSRLSVCLSVMSVCHVCLSCLSVCLSVCHVCLSVCPSVLQSAWNNSAPTWGFFMKIYAWVSVENLSRNLNVHYNLTKLKSSLHEDLCIFMIACYWIILRMRNVSLKCSIKTQNTFLFWIKFFRKSYH